MCSGPGLGTGARALRALRARYAHARLPVVPTGVNPTSEGPITGSPVVGTERGPGHRGDRQIHTSSPTMSTMSENTKWTSWTSWDRRLKIRTLPYREKGRRAPAPAGDAGHLISAGLLFGSQARKAGSSSLVVPLMNTHYHPTTTLGTTFFRWAAGDPVFPECMGGAVRREEHVRGRADGARRREDEPAPKKRGPRDPPLRGGCSP
eukprot:gene15474-biopygen4970